MSTASPACSMADPIISANIYCSQYINDLLRVAVAPFRSEMRDATDGHGFLWFFRYGKRGEHLKLRLHAPDGHREALQARLAPVIARFLDTIDPAAPEHRLSKSALPALDVEDEPDEDHPDRAMLWTHYRRSPVVVGDPIYTLDDHHMARFARAAAACSDFLLDEVLPASRDDAYLQRRQSAFLKLIIAGMAATDFTAATWVTYFTYHHDWLVRHLVAHGPRAVDEAELRAEIERHLDNARGAVPALAGVMSAQRAERRDGRISGGPLGAWSDAVHNFFAYVQGYRGQAQYDRDPYTDDHSFLPLFKVFHACANQIGLRISNEAYLYGLLREAAIASADHEAA